MIVEVLPEKREELFSQEMPFWEQLYAFLKEIYREDRFEGRQPPEWEAGYSHRICQDRYNDLQTIGYSSVSHHCTKNRESYFFDRSLNPIDFRGLFHG